WNGRLGRTRGFRSEAVCGAASAARSLTSRCRWSWPSSSSAGACGPPGPSLSASTDGRSPRRRDTMPRSCSREARGLSQLEPRRGGPGSIDQHAPVVAAVEADAQALPTRIAGREVLADDRDKAGPLAGGDDDRGVAVARIDSSAGAEADDVPGHRNAPRARNADTDRWIEPIDGGDEVSPVLDAGPGACPDPVRRPQVSRRQLDTLERVPACCVERGCAVAGGGGTCVHPVEAVTARGV